MRLEAQSIARTTSPERILETSASLNDAQVAIVVPACEFEGRSMLIWQRF